jgi:DNA-binding transcriptional ArsR family regulator
MVVRSARIEETASPVQSMTDDEIDRLFHALADRTRRDIVERTMSGDQSISALASRYTMSFAAVQKHVAVLERAHLVRKERRGREQIVRTDIETVRSAQALLDELEAMWRERFERFGTVLISTLSERPEATTTPEHPQEGPAS